MNHVVNSSSESLPIPGEESRGTNLAGATVVQAAAGVGNSQKSDIDDLDSAEKDGKPFRIQNLRIHLTYRSHIDPTKWLEWAASKKLAIEEYSIVNETGGSEYDHTHILLRFSKKFETLNVRFFDYEGIHPHIKLVKTDQHWKRTVKYHTKQGKPVYKIKDRTIIESIWSHPTVGDAIVNVCSSLKEVGGVIGAFGYKPIDYGAEPMTEWKPWQKQLYEELGQKPDSRKILWYWDPRGNSGKTFFAKHMGMYKGAFVTTKANSYHLATMIQEQMKRGPASLMVIFNFTRQVECHKVYTAIENLKDGLMTAEKYHGGTLYFDNPHVVVFANYLPEFDAVSLDRWHLRVIDNLGSNLIADCSNKDIEVWIRNEMKSKGLSLKEATRLLIETLEGWATEQGILDK